ncbi:branched-chain amino acid transaminase [Aureisphaera galaxeae]|uniref:branched-chain amino acid transaminase n=1 Tax=Aureisphaera galaxeae TaxID=1538023 RepID=UPI00234FC873|nr:branched-chain amino acid transaminase [Aureisphaera galaxeae]MDC8003137.1 branched-chain amino acid transaminase [Aureisphaera galaxeae]
MYYDQETQVYLDGAWIKASEAQTGLYSQTLHYGNGVFEGIRAYQTDDGPQIFKAKEHYERFLYSAEVMHIPCPYSVDELIKLSYELLDKNGFEDAYIRPLLYQGEMMTLQPAEKSHLLLCAWEWGKYLGTKEVRLMTSSYQRPNPKSTHIQAKLVGHYTNSIMATTEAKANGYDEALLLDQYGYVAEGPGANFFYEKNGVLYTCPLGNILSGITRQTVFEMAEELEIVILEKHFTPSDVYKADGAFFTGTAAEIAPIKSLDGKEFNKPWKETLGYRLSELYQKLVRAHTTHFFEPAY